MRASFTVEISLLMTVILPVLFSLILLGFYLHDKAILEGAVWETASMGFNLKEYDSWEGDTKKVLASTTGQGMTWTSKGSTSCSVSEEQVSAGAEGSFKLPALVSRFLGKSSLTLKAQGRRDILCPQRVIRRVRGVHYLWTLLEGGGDGS